jgi:phosphoglycerate dehydrogenase-like enzyme
MEIKTFGVIGAGQMGNGIAQVAAASGSTTGRQRRPGPQPGPQG